MKYLMSNCFYSGIEILTAGGRDAFTSLSPGDFNQILNDHIKPITLNNNQGVLLQKLSEDKKTYYKDLRRRCKNRVAYKKALRTKFLAHENE